MPAGFDSAGLRLGLATVAMACLGHASSILETQPAGQPAPSTWLQPLVLGGLPREGVLGVEGDRDYFRMDVAGPTLAVIYTSGDVDTAGVLFDADGREMVSDDDGGDGDNFRIEAVLPQRGTCYLRVQHGDSSRTGGYTLHAERLESPRPLVLGGPPQEDAISTRGELDFFRLEVTEPTLVAVYASGGLDTTGTLLDPHGRAIARDRNGGDGDNFRIEAVLPRHGTYYLRVQQGYSSRTGGYTLHAARLESPRPLVLGGPPQEDAVSTDGKADFFRLDVAGPIRAAIYTRGGADTRGVLYDPDGRWIASDDDLGEGDLGEGRNFHIDMILPRRGTYYLKVQHSSYSTGSYTLHAERLEWPDALRLGGTPLEGAISTAGEVDYFRLDTTGPTLAAVYASGDFGDSEGVLFDPDGRAFAWDDDGGEGLNFRIETVLPRRGTYYLKVQESVHLYPYRTGSYTVHAERLGSESPVPLRLGGPPQQGAILTDAEEDFYRLDVTEPIKVAVHTIGGVDTGGELYDPDGRLVASDDDGGEGNNFRIDTVLLRRGAYWLRILSSHPATTGSYTLHAEGTTAAVEEDDVHVNGIYRPEGTQLLEAGAEGGDVFVLHDGRILAFDSSSNGSILFASGTYSSDGNDLTGRISGVSTTGFRVSSFINSALSGIVTEENSIDLKFAHNDGTQHNVRLQFDNLYDRRSSLSMWQGVWERVASGVTLWTVTVDADGALSGKMSDGCELTGGLSILEAAHNLYDLQITVESCSSEGDYSGFAYLDSAREGGRGVFFFSSTFPNIWFKLFALTRAVESRSGIGPPTSQGGFSITTERRF